MMEKINRECVSRRKYYIKEIGKGFLAGLFGIMLASLVIELSGFYNDYFFAGCFFVYSVTIYRRFLNPR